MDLASLESLAQYNDGYKFILCVIDVFSKFSWGVALKSKNASTVLDALKGIIKNSERHPEKKIWVDKGSEFYNSAFLGWAKSNDIIVYSTFGESESAVAERFIRTLRELPAKKFSAIQSYRWVKMLPSVLNFYNNKYHKTIYMSPLEASDPSSSLDIFFRYEVKPNKKNKKHKFKIGNQARISRLKGNLEKGSDVSWSHEVYPTF